MVQRRDLLKIAALTPALLLPTGAAPDRAAETVTDRRRAELDAMARSIAGEPEYHLMLCISRLAYDPERDEPDTRLAILNGHRVAAGWRFVDLSTKRTPPALLDHPETLTALVRGFFPDLDTYPTLLESVIGPEGLRLAATLDPPLRLDRNG